ncbi:hypothetical protein JXB41_03375 [Candidatus Woesearchaeota archaeon]|nr:hypothetical protein [Candidatus Woesearchaeota archaeon]
MKIKIRKTNKDGFVRMESSGEVKEIMINEDFMHPQNESIALCFKGKDSSGIIELRTDEIEILFDQIRSRIHLIKGFNRLSAISGGKLL